MRLPKLLAACGLLILLGCRSPLQPPPDIGGDGPMGTLLLSIDRPGARTILPDFGIRDFSEIRLDFENVTDSGDTFYRTLAGTDFDLHDTTPGAAISLPVGTWYLTVTAFLDSASYPYHLVPSARCNSEDPVQIVLGQPAHVSVEIFLIDCGNDNCDCGEGTFSWAIDFECVIAADDQAALRLRLRIWPWPMLAGPPVVDDDSFDIPPGSTHLSDTVDLNAGRYYVVFTLYRETSGELETASISAILHVAANMGSRFEGPDATFVRYDFPSFQAALLNLVLGAWNPVSDEWNFADHGIAPGHFSILGIDGVTTTIFHAGPNTGLIWWLNHLTPGRGVPTTVEELRELVDLALYNIRANLNSLVVQLDELRLAAGDGDEHLINIGDDETITYAETSLAAFADRDITLTLVGVGEMRTVQLGGTGSLFDIPDGVTLVFGENVTLRGVGGNDAPLVMVADGGVLEMLDGSAVTGNTNDPDVPANRGGGVYVADGGTFAMRGGEIFDNHAECSGYGAGGGGVRVSGTFNMEGGAIFGNTASGNGGGVHIVAASTYYGIPPGLFTMSGGVIGGVAGGAPASANSAYNGAGVFVAGRFVMEGNAIIRGNIAVNSGGGAFVNAYGGEFVIGGSAGISGNTATNGSGGGVFIGSGWNQYIVGGRLYMEGTAAIHGNTAEGGSGGGVFIGGGIAPTYVRDGTFNMRGGAIHGNNAAGDGDHGSGGGVHNIGIFRISDGHILGSDAEAGLTGNSARRLGAAIYNAATAWHGTFGNGVGTFNQLGYFPGGHIDSAIHVQNGRLQLTGTVRITGIPQVGRLLTADTRALVGGGTPTFQWYRGQNSTFTPIAGATGSTYTPQYEDLGQLLRVSVRRAYSYGYVVSAPTDPVGPWEDLGNVHFDLATDPQFQGLPVGVLTTSNLVTVSDNRLRLAEYWESSGASIAIINENGANRLRVTVNYAWGGVELLHNGFGFLAGDTVLIAGRVEEANQITLNGNPDPAGGWRPLGEGPLQLSADAPFLIEHTLTQEDIDIFAVLATPNIRLVGDVENATFIITELTVTRGL